MGKISYILLTLLILLPLPLVSSCSRAGDSIAPDFTITIVGGGKDEWLNRTVSLSDFKGTPIVIHFTASWCVACKRIFETLTRDYKGVFVMGVGVLDRKPDFIDFIRSQSLPVPVGYDEDGVITSGYEVSTLPLTIFIDKHGVIVERIAGVVEGERLKEIMKKVEA